MAAPTKYQYIWVGRSGPNVDADRLKGSTVQVTLHPEDPHPLQRRELFSGNKTENDLSAKNALKGRSKTYTSVVKETEFIDPLTAMSEQADQLVGGRNRLKSDYDDSDTFFDSTDSSNSDSSTQESFWRCLECDVLAESQSFNGKIEIPSSMSYLLPKMEDQENENNLSSVSARLEWLESNHRGKLGKNGLAIETQNNLLTATQFINFVETTNNQLAKHWKDDQRVSVVKLVIQAAKMLSEPDPQILKFYPALFFTLTDLITYFGQLVYDRLVSKCPGLRMNFTLSDVSDTAKELCKNWLYKIASIRELVPRFYLETSLLRCYRFSCNIEGFPALIERLILMVRGIGDPLVASYARVYLSFAVQQALQATSPQLVRNVARQNYEEFLSNFKYVGINEVKFLSADHLTEYLIQYSPAIRWFIAVQTVGLTNDDPIKDRILRRCLNELDNLKHPGVVLANILDSFSQQIFTGEVTFLCQLVTTCEDTGYPIHLLLRTFGRKLVEHSTALTTKTKTVLLSILNQCWKVIMKLGNVDHYLSCATVFIEFCTQHFGSKELDVLLGDVLAHVTGKLSQPDLQSEDSMAIVVSILKLSIGLTSKSEVHIRSTPSERMSELPHLMALIDCLDQGNRVLISREILESFQSSKLVSNELQDLKPPDPESILHLSGILADSVNALTIQDETRQISQIICCALSDLHFYDDFDRKLKFLTDCRATFRRLEIVQIHLVHSVLNMAMEALQRVAAKNDYSKRRPRIHGFLQACCAFAFISIPSISHICTKLRLYLLTAQVGYHSRCFGQAEDCIKSAVALIQETATDVQNNRLLSIRDSQEVETFLIQDFVPNLCSYLIVAPDLALKQEFLLLTVIKSILGGVRILAKDNQWGICQVYLTCLQTVSVATWSVYPYHIDGVDSSDTIFFGSAAVKNGFINQMNKLGSSLLDQLLHRLEYYEEIGDHFKKSQLAQNILDVILRFCSLEEKDSKMCSLSLKLWKIASDPKGSTGLRQGSTGLRQGSHIQKVLQHWKSLPGTDIAQLVERMEKHLIVN